MYCGDDDDVHGGDDDGHDGDDDVHDANSMVVMMMMFMMIIASRYQLCSWEAWGEFLVWW